MSKGSREMIFGQTVRFPSKSCRKCGLDFQYGDIIISKMAAHGRNGYHKKCWEKLFQ